MDTVYMKMSCYGRFNSYRIAVVGMQRLDELFSRVFRAVSHGGRAV